MQDIGADGHGEWTNMWVNNDCKHFYRGDPLACMMAAPSDRNHHSADKYSNKPKPINVGTYNPSKGRGSMVMEDDVYHYTYEILELPTVCNQGKREQWEMTGCNKC